MASRARRRLDARRVGRTRRTCAAAAAPAPAACPRAPTPPGPASRACRTPCWRAGSASAPASAPLGDDVAHPLVVGAVGEDELDLVARADVLEVRPAVAVRLAAARALQVHDLVHARIDPRDVRLAARLDEHRLARVAQLAQQRADAGLEQRLSAGQLHERRAEGERARQHVLAGHARAAVEGLRRVAPHAAQVAARRAHEGAGQPGERRFALDARVDLVDDERVFLHGASSRDLGHRHLARVGVVGRRGRAGRARASAGGARVVVASAQPAAMSAQRARAARRGSAATARKRGSTKRCGARLEPATAVLLGEAHGDCRVSVRVASS